MKQKFSQIEQRKGEVHVNLKAEKGESKLIEGRITRKQQNRIIPINI